MMNTESQEESNLTPEQTKALGALGARFAEGESMASIFGIDEAYLQMAEHRGYELYQHGRYEDARTIALGLIALAPSRYYAYLLIGDIELKQLSVAEARTYLERAFERSPKNVPVLAKMGEACLRGGDIEEGCGFLEEVIKLVEEEEDPHYLRARALLKVCASEKDS